MRKTLIASVLALAAGAAQAADNGFYLGAGVSQASIDEILGSDSQLEIDNTSWKLIAGLRPIDLVAVELNYMDLGDESVGLPSTSFDLTGEADAKAFSAYALGFLPLPVPFLDVYGKLGLARWEIDGRIREGGVDLLSLDESGTEFAYGAGAQVSFGSLAARLEYERFDIDQTDGLELFTLGVTWTFL